MFSVKEVLLVILVCESVLFSICSFILRPLRSYTNYFLFFLTGTLGAVYALALINCSGNVEIIVNLQPLTFIFFLLINPLYLLYVKSLTTDQFKFTWYHKAQFLPSVLLGVLLIVFYLPLDFQEKVIILNNTVSSSSPLILKFTYGLLWATPVLYYIQIALNTYLMVKLIVNHKKRITNYFSSLESISLNWLVAFIIMYILNGLFEVSVYFFYSAVMIEHLENWYYVFMIIMVTFIGFFGLKQSDIYSSNVNQPKTNSATTGIKVPEPSEKKEIIQKYKQSKISEDVKRMIKEKLDHALKEERIFLRRDLSLDELATHLDVNKNYLSQVINEKYQKSFYTLINEQRVCYAALLLTDPAFEMYSLDGLAELSGFNSRFTLNTAFKKIKGFSPSQYKQNYNT